MKDEVEFIFVNYNNLHSANSELPACRCTGSLNHGCCGSIYANQLFCGKLFWVTTDPNSQLRSVVQRSLGSIDRTGGTDTWNGEIRLLFLWCGVVCQATRVMLIEFVYSDLFKLRDMRCWFGGGNWYTKIYQKVTCQNIQKR